MQEEPTTMQKDPSSKLQCKKSQVVNARGIKQATKIKFTSHKKIAKFKLQNIIEV